MYQDKEILSDEENKYKLIEKKYKVHFITHDSKNNKQLRRPRRSPMPDLSDVIDFMKYNLSDENHVNLPSNIKRIVFRPENYDVKLYSELERRFEQVVHEKGYDTCPDFLKLPPPNQWKVYTLTDYPGFYFISQLFTPRQQLFWIKQCLKEYPQPPNLTNHFPFLGLLDDLWEKAQRGEPIKPDSKEMAHDLVNKMAWSTLGYQYDWTNRKYHPQQKVPFPDDAGTLVTMIACAANYSPFSPEAAIVNYYNKDKSMGGHRDDAEYAMDKPIISISFGSDAIFLLGGESKKIEPVPMILHSGDLMIMGGRSRFCFHGVARVIDDSLPIFLQSDHFASARQQNEDAEEFREKYLPFIRYLNSSTRRLNINARQVFSYDENGNLIDPFVKSQ
jgi:alkylated DNA repair protein alkB family protein 1